MTWPRAEGTGGLLRAICQHYWPCLHGSDAFHIGPHPSVPLSSPRASSPGLRPDRKVIAWFLPPPWG